MTIPSQNNPVDGEPFMPKALNSDPLLKDPETGRTFRLSDTPSVAGGQTPRTDAVEFETVGPNGSPFKVVEVDFARTLERELNDLQRYYDMNIVSWKERESQLAALQQQVEELTKEREIVKDNEGALIIQAFVNSANLWLPADADAEHNHELAALHLLHNRAVVYVARAGSQNQARE